MTIHSHTPWNRTQGPDSQDSTHLNPAAPKSRAVATPWATRRHMALVGAVALMVASALLVLPTSRCFGLETATVAPRHTARIARPGTMTVGVFSPLSWVPSQGLELRTHPLVFAASPNGLLRKALLVGGDGGEGWHLTAEAGLSLPWGVFRMAPPLGLKGYLVPSCKVAAAEPNRQTNECQQPGLFLVPRLGIVASHGEQAVVTARVDGAVGVPLNGERTSPLDSYPYLDLLFAPVFNTYRARVGLRYDHPLRGWLRIAGELNGYLLGRGPEPHRSPLILSTYLGFDIALGEGTRLTAGATYWNSDQRRVVFRKDSDGYTRLVPVRSHDFAPTLDLIWSW